MDKLTERGSSASGRERSTMESERSAVERLLAVGLALVVTGGLVGSLVGGGGFAGTAVGAETAVGGPASSHGLTPQAGGLDAQAGQDGVDLDVDCDEGVVRAIAPETFDYTLRVTDVLTSPTGSEVITTATTESGNATANLTEIGLVYASVSADGEVVASLFENCAASGEQGADNETTQNVTTRTETTETHGPGVASVEADCDASEVRVNASEDFAYDLRVVSVVATASETTVATRLRTATGNATVPVEEASAIAVFVSNETGTVASTVENCELADQGRETTEGPDRQTTEGTEQTTAETDR